MSQLDAQYLARWAGLHPAAAAKLVAAIKAGGGVRVHLPLTRGQCAAPASAPHRE